MNITLHTSLEDIAAADWNALAAHATPFLRYEFLAALERHGCVGERYGWIPQHLSARADNGDLVGVQPMYLKDNSYGEFVFDWSWADAYERAGMSYYPKLVVAVPYTPATGPRQLVRAGPEYRTVAKALVQASLDLARERKVSSLHWLFTTETQTQALEQAALLRRTGCQFHWQNQDYSSFDDFLERFSAQGRKKIKRERRHVRDAGITLEIVHGHEATAEQWDMAHRFYRSTFQRKSGTPTLSLSFFKEISTTMGEAVVLVLACHQGRYVAGAINLRDETTLYGRHWGCVEEFHSLHFEACYYQGIDYCIRHNLQRFEPGAQGEHKLSRGFLPTPTWSAHWIADPRWRHAIADFLSRESAGMNHYIDDMHAHSPYKTAGDIPAASILKSSA